MMVLQETPVKTNLDRITDFLETLNSGPGFEKGVQTCKQDWTLTRPEEKQGKANMPGHVRASINWNTLKRMNGDKYLQEIVDGMKVIFCKLKQNP